MRFYSKHDVWLGIVIFVPTTYSLLQTYLDSGLSITTYLLLIVFFFILWIWLGTYYEIKDGCLFVRSGPFHGTYDISKINSIRNSRSCQSSAACSLDRLEIRGETFNELISPKNKTAFILALQEINASIKYNESR